MIPLLVPLGAFLGVLFLTLRSIGLGFVGVLAVGYVYGVVRANLISIQTTFMFDAGLLGLYLGFFAGRSQDAVEVFNTTAGHWVLALILWPALLCVFPVNDFLVQLVALRATVWFLPVLLVASRMRSGDLTVLARGLAVLNLVALAGGIYVYQFGVESLYPKNAVTEIIYQSKDVGGNEYYRIPSIFITAHVYGGAMLFTLPFLLDRLFGREVGLPDRALAAAGVAAAVGGILMCAARQPLVMFMVAALVALLFTRLNPIVTLVTVVFGAAVVLVASTDERLQRVTTLTETEFVSERIRGSANESFFELMADYPVGAGMGSSAGTSIPYFLADRAPVAIGLENEYSRVLVDQGLIGLGLWVAFLVWLLYRPPPLRLSTPWGTGVILMYALVLTNWATAFIGTGTLSAVPGAVMILIQMGILVRVREVTGGNRA
jgi:hypothetical protein